jgi:hypothetical protein
VVLSKPDWKLTRLPRRRELLPYEQPRRAVRGQDRGTVGPRKTFAERLQKVKNAIYKDVVDKKFAPADSASDLADRAAALRDRHRDRCCSRFTISACSGCPGDRRPDPLIGASGCPAHGQGTAITRRVNGFRRVVETAEEHMSKWAEQENVFTRYLPYAIVFGVTEKWARTFEALGQLPSDDMSWYVSTRPFAYAAFADGLDSFAVTTSGVIASTPSGSGGSGFGGGGFSGGGGGGGGGGSW